MRCAIGSTRSQLLWWVAGDSGECPRKGTHQQLHDSTPHIGTQWQVFDNSNWPSSCCCVSAVYQEPLRKEASWWVEDSKTHYVVDQAWCFIPSYGVRLFLQDSRLLDNHNTKRGFGWPTPCWLPFQLHSGQWASVGDCLQTAIAGRDTTYPKADVHAFFPVVMNQMSPRLKFCLVQTSKFFFQSQWSCELLCWHKILNVQECIRSNQHFDTMTKEKDCCMILHLNATIKESWQVAMATIEKLRKLTHMPVHCKVCLSSRE